MIAALDYGMGNLRSLTNALAYVGIDVELVADPSRLLDASAFSHVILPGVGAFGRAMTNLRARGFIEPIRAHVDAGKPLLGICLGMQLLATKSFEFGENEGLGLIPGVVVPFERRDEFPVPHVGWNNVTFTRKHPSLAKAKKDVDYYFVHSFHVVTDEPEAVVATSDYGRTFSSIIGRANVIGVQFHPEKSQAGGLALLESFSEWDGTC